MSHRRRVVPAAALACAALMCIAGPRDLAAQDAAHKADLPVLLTSCGQSPGPEQVRFFLNRLKLAHEYLPQARAKDLSAARAAGKPYGSLLIVTGASLKGMGAAGVALPAELARTAELIREAQKQGITIIGAHVEGMARRAQGAAPGDNSDEQSIDAVMPFANLLVVRKDGDQDRRFTTLSAKHKVPLILFEKNMELGQVLTGIFGR